MIMKKQYIVPQTEIVKYHVKASLLIGSSLQDKEEIENPTLIIWCTFHHSIKRAALHQSAALLLFFHAEIGAAYRGDTPKQTGR